MHGFIQRRDEVEVEGVGDAPVQAQDRHRAGALRPYEITGPALAGPHSTFPTIASHAVTFPAVAYPRLRPPPAAPHASNSKASTPVAPLGKVPCGSST